MRNIYKISVVMVLLLVATSCKKYLDINSNPAIPQVVKAELLLPPIEYQMHNGVWQDYRSSLSKLTQNLAGVTNSTSFLPWEQHGYITGSDVGGVVWRMNYFDLGLNLENMIKDAVTNQKYEYAGIGYAIKAWSYQTTTDEYGPMILDEAFTEGQLTFKYQDQPDVYAKVREWSDLAIKYLNMTSPLNYTATLQGPTGDQIYKGDKAKWKKFVYALLATQYGHLINKADFKTKYADSVAKYVDLSFANESEDATVFFSAAGTLDVNQAGPTNAFNTGVLGSAGQYGRQTTTILNLLTGGVRGTAAAGQTSSVDPRLNKMLIAGTAVNGVGVVTGTTYTAVTPTLGTSSTSVPTILGSLPANALLYTGKYIFTDRARWPIMTYSQLQFIKAEAQFIKGNTTDAFTSYINGIKGHMDFYNTYGRTSPLPDALISTTEINTYLASSEVAQNAASLTKADIMQQKYIAQWGWAAVEQWCDLRKYHYDPTIFRTYVLPPTISLFPSNGGKLMYRMRPRYNSEYLWNIAELTKFGGNLPNYNTQELWFSLP